jgi:DNA replication protein DnaC
MIDDRSRRRPTIVTSQLLVVNWHQALGDPTSAGDILDRVTHNARRLGLSGDSLRRRPASSVSV